MRIGVLGTLAVHDDAGQPVHVGGHRVRMLLILLALDAGRVVPAYSIIDRLWDDQPPANASNSLQSLISRLRTSLRQAGAGGSVIESHPAGYRLAIPAEQVDAVAFEAKARAGSQALARGDALAAGRVLREALGFWRGPALADASGAEFAVGPAARLEEVRASAQLDLIEAGLALGEGDALVGELRAVVAADPVAERPRGLLMRALQAAGRQAEALAVYQETREVLADRLGVDPSRQLQQIYLAVLRQGSDDGRDSVPGRVPAGRGSPEGADQDSTSAERLVLGAPWFGPRMTGARKPLTSFVGRDEDVARVRKMLAEGRLVTLTGPGGSGKTRLASEAAAVLAADPAGGLADAAAAPGQSQAGQGSQVWFAGLAPVTDATEVPYAVLDALGIREIAVIARASASQPRLPADPVDRLVAALAGRRALLILDNCEHVVAAAAALADQVLAGCPGVRILATSREPLRITGETLWPVPPLPVPPLPVPAEPLPERGREASAGITPADATSSREQPGDAAGDPVAGYASVRLLADRAAAVRPDFRVDAGNAADVARICRALDGLPLAIELAAARLRTLSAAQLAERLDARFDLLTGGSRTAVPRHQTLRAVVDWSWELLSEPEQVLARRLAIFPDGATLAAAEEACEGGALPAAGVLPAIFGLVEKSFLSLDSDGEPRYRMLETVQAYCLEHLAEAGEEDGVRLAFATYFVRLAETADPLLRTGEQHTWMRRLTAEQDNMHAALRWAIDRRDSSLALRFGQALGWFWLLRGQRRESGALAREILAISEPAGDAGPVSRDLEVVQARAVCALTAVNASWDIGEFKQPLADAESRVTPDAGAGPGDRPPHPLVVIGIVMFALYEHRDPYRALRLLAAHFASADPWTRAGARLMHAMFSMNLGRLDGVPGEFAEAFAGFQAIGDRWGMAVALMVQADLYALDGDHARAIAALEQAVELSGELVAWEEAAQMYASLARSRSRAGDYRDALADLARAERAAGEQGESESDLWISYVKAELAWLRGDFAESSDISKRLDARMASKNATLTSSFRAQALNRGALADIRCGNLADGHAALATALRLARDSQERSAVAVVVDGLAAAALWTDGSRASAERAAVLLGTAHSIRGAFDHSSLDAPAARDEARQALGDRAFEAAYHRGRELSYTDALAYALEDSPASTPPASAPPPSAPPG